MDIERILKEMTLEDKIALCSGASFWETKRFERYGIPALFMCDGPHGLRKQEDAADMLGVNNSRPATCFPAEVTTAGSWDPALLEQIGAAIGEEALEQDVGLVLGPGANLKRNPLCGRNFEYFSEDPYLAGKLAAGFIRGLEAQGVGTEGGPGVQLGPAPVQRKPAQTGQHAPQRQRGTPHRHFPAG